MKRIGLILLVAIIVIGFAACSPNESTTTTAVEASIQEPEASSQVLEESEDSAQEIESDETEQLPSIVVTSVALVEILDAMDIPVIGVPTSDYTLPERAKDTTKIGMPMAPDAEIIQSLNPEYILSVKALEPTLGETFKALGINANFFDLNSFEALLGTIEELGTLFGKEKEAALLKETLTTAQTNASEVSKEKEAPTVLIIFGASENFQVATEKSYVGNLVSLVGGKNIIGEVSSGFIPVDMEYLADKNPEYILLLAHANPENTKAAFEHEFASNEAWQNFDAVVNNKVIILETGTFGMSANLKAGDALDQLVEIFYNEQN